MVAAGKFAVSLVQSWSEFDQHRDPWTKVWSADPHAELFTNFDWLAAIAQAYGEGLTPCCPVITRAGEPVAILLAFVTESSTSSAAPAVTSTI
jgi:hypothetical protein